MAPSSAGAGKRLQQHDNAKSNQIGEHASSTKRWKDVPRGTMDEVSSYVGLDLLSLDGKADQKIVPLILESHTGRALVPIPKRSASLQATSTLSGGKA